MCATLALITTKWTVCFYKDHICVTLPETSFSPLIGTFLSSTGLPAVYPRPLIKNPLNGLSWKGESDQSVSSLFICKNEQTFSTVKLPQLEKKKKKKSHINKGQCNGNVTIKKSQYLKRRNHIVLLWRRLVALYKVEQQPETEQHQDSGWNCPPPWWLRIQEN